ncbi:MAG TPA: hypothetical protein P5107_11590 [Thermotogota bacterium]|nr:hypothetical protein [Thermotogota bacterium]HRW35684.1 hypothetical protein [Thermotogota bacterium]
MVQSAWIMILIFVAIGGYMIYSSLRKKSLEKQKIQEFKDRVYEYIYQQGIKNPFVIYNDIEASGRIPREILRKLNAFDYIDDAVKKAKREG